MNDHIRAFEDVIRKNLALAHGANRVNVLDPSSVREDIASAYRDIESDEVEHGGHSAGNFCDLTMADWSPEEPAVFILTAWTDSSVSVYCGAADRQAVLDICDGHSMDEVEEALADFARLGFAGTPATIPRDEAEAWVRA
jgi:hypothetical protein